MKISKKEYDGAVEVLRDRFELKPGDTIYTSLIHCSKSGMYRVIDLFVIRDNEPLRITGYAAKLLEGYDDRHEGARASGCGMDMGYHLVNNLGYALFPDGFECTGGEVGHLGSCPSNDHSNGDRDYTPHYHRSGGYAFRHKWL